jgi:voltage-gated potassium channel
MVSIMIGLARFWLAIRKVWSDPTFRLVATLSASLLVVGMFLFHWVEGWSYLDSFYFSAISATTVGYGDFSPKTPAGKLLAVFYIFCGIGLLVALVTRFAEALVQAERENQERLHLHLMQAHEKIAPRGASAVEPAPAEPPLAEEEPLP